MDIDALKKYFLPGVKVREVSARQEKRKTFFGSLEKKKVSETDFFLLIGFLEEAADNSESLFEAGIDLYEFESLYLDAIEILMRNTFKEPTLDLIHIYLYGVPLNYDEKTSPEELEKITAFETVEDLWKAVQELESKNK